MRWPWKFFVVWAGTAVVVDPVKAIPAAERWGEAGTYDGCMMKVQLVGDAAVNFWRTEDGVQLCRRKDLGYTLMDGNMTCTDEKISCETVARKGEVEIWSHGRRKSRLETEQLLAASVAFGPSYVEKQLANVANVKSNKAGENLVEKQTMRNLVLMIRFKDHTSKTLPSPTSYGILFNSDTVDENFAQTGSLKTYYLAQSYGKLQIDSVLSGWVDVSYTEAEAAGGNDSSGPCHGFCTSAMLHEAIREGLTIFEEQNPDLFATFDSDNDSLVDMFTVIHSGYGAETGSQKEDAASWIWSHRGFFSANWISPINKIVFRPYNINAGLWGESGNGITRLGVIAHEVAHYLGLPDLYDVDSSSYGAGFYDVMANSWGKDGTQHFPGSFSCPSKNLLGWVDPIIIKGGSESKGRFTLKSFQETGDCYLLPLNHDPTGGLSPSEQTSFQYILLENRRPYSWDSLLSGGILMWHVDNGVYFTVYSGKTVTNPDANRYNLRPFQPETWASEHFAVRLIQADLKFDLELKVNQEDQADWWRRVDLLANDDELFPNLQTYELAAEGIRSGHSFSDFSQSSSFSSDGAYDFTYDFVLKDGRINLPTEPIDDDGPSLSTLGWVAVGVGSFFGIAAVGLLVAQRILQHRRNKEIERRRAARRDKKRALAAKKDVENANLDSDFDAPSL